MKKITLGKKRGKMKKQFLVALGVFLLLFSIFGIADEDLGIPCFNDIECEEFGDDAYCDLDLESCFILSEEDFLGEGLGEEDDFVDDGSVDDFVDDGSVGDDFVDEEDLIIGDEDIIIEDDSFEAIEIEAEAYEEEDDDVLGVVTLAGTAAEVRELWFQVNFMREAVDDLLARADSLELENQELQQQLTSVNTDLENLNMKLGNVKNVQGELDAMAVGLASMQQNLEETSTELEGIESDLEKKDARNKILSYGIFILLVAIITGGAMYYINKKSSAKGLHPQILQYITHHIKQGKKYPHVKQNLLKAGWSEHEVDWAYKHTMKHNYNKYLQKKGAPKTVSQTAAPRTTPKPRAKPEFDRKKVVFISIFSILIIIGAIFVLKGVTTGKAIHFASEQEMSAAAENLLEIYLKNNEFYDSINFEVDFCVEIKDLDKRISYHVVKSSQEHTVEEVNVPCSLDPNYDFAIKFTDWNTFNIVMRRMTCENIQQGHSLNLEAGKRGFYVLPSKYIMPGFEFNPDEDLAQFCPILERCLSSLELGLIGC